MLSHINLNDNVIDVGGNNGEVALRVGKKIGSEGCVVSFEPLSVNVERFKANMLLNPAIDNIVLVYIGVGDTEGMFSIVNDRPDNLGMGWIEEVNATSGMELCDTEDVVVTTLDNFIPSMKLDHIDFIKIDVEGFELKVLTGASHIISSHRPKLFIEVVEEHLERKNTSALELVEYLENKRYLMYNSATGEVVDRNTDFSYMMDMLAVPM